MRMVPEPILVAESAELRRVLHTAGIVAPTRATVLLRGESGTGKEMLARYLHAKAWDGDRPFVAVNCASLPETLVESELFGYRRGAFSGAQGNRAGFIRSADGGTLFLDEIGELPPAAQAKLLRFLESGEVQPLGSDRPSHVRAWVLAATNCDLEAMVRDGRFRTDLYYRLNVVPLDLPPLRDRRADVAPLAQYFVRLFADRYGLRLLRFESAALDLMCRYPWPGNVRELKNLCERLTILAGARREPIRAVELLPHLRWELPGHHAAAAGAPAPFSLVHSERELIRRALEQSGGNRTSAARLLGVTRYALLYRMKKYGFDTPRLTADTAAPTA